MNVFNHYMLAFKNYANFSGRTTRSEYWFFVLFNFVFAIGCAAIHSGLYGLYYLATLIPSLSAAVRRMHDVGKSGWFLLIPFYGLILACLPSEQTVNKYGEPPSDHENVPMKKASNEVAPNLDDLGKLHELFKAGAIDQAEFEEQKNKILKKAA